MNPLDLLFPDLQRNGYQITSPRDREYNCIAWAAGDTTRWWWPDPAEEGYWPAAAPVQETLVAFVAAFATLGFGRTDSETLEPGVEKVALFAKDGVKPTHAARQLPSGRWTSKMGRSEDIEHDLRDLEGDVYGAVVVVLQRPILDGGGV